MRNYKLIVYKMMTEDGYDVIAEYPALKGVVGVGKTEIEAISNLIDSAESNIEALISANLPVPTEDAFISDDYSGKLSLRLSKGMHKKVANIAYDQGISINQFLVEAVSSYVTKETIEIDINKNILELVNATTKMTLRYSTGINRKISNFNKYLHSQEVYVKEKGYGNEQFAS